MTSTTPGRVSSASSTAKERTEPTSPKSSHREASTTRTWSVGLARSFVMNAMMTMMFASPRSLYRSSFAAYYRELRAQPRPGESPDGHLEPHAFPSCDVGQPHHHQAFLEGDSAQQRSHRYQSG